MDPKDFSGVTSRLRQAIVRTASDAASRSNLSSLQTQIDAIARGDLATSLAQALPDVVLSIFAPPEFPYVRHAQGLDALKAALEHNFNAVEDQHPTVLNIFAEGNTVVLFGRETGRIPRTGTTYNVEFVQKFTFRDGRLAEVRITAAHTAPVGD
ncbi:MAG TPA: nuclear transport factor 2 family protein [Vicinamibacterales bacterium]|jgi:hypothetical protein